MDGGVCRQCIEPADPMAGRWGPLYIRPGTYEVAVNAPGCGALINHDTSTTGCGKKLADYTGCSHYTCDHCNAGADAFDLSPGISTCRPCTRAPTESAPLAPTSDAGVTGGGDAADAAAPWMPPTADR